MSASEHANRGAESLLTGKPARVTDIIAALRDNPYYTFEFFPPKTYDGLINLRSRMSRMLSELKPSCVHITWGAGGSTSKMSLDLAVMAQDQLGIPAVLHLTCTNMEKQMLKSTLDRAKELGVVNILALRGDPPRGEEYWIATDPQFQYAADLVRYIRTEFGNDFCIGVAGYPEGPPDTIFDSSKEIDRLKEKVDAGADFVVTQLFYDTQQFIQWNEQCKQLGIQVPIIPGIMPIQNYASFRRLTKLCKARIPENIAEDLSPIQNDDRAVKAYGVQLSIKQISQLMQSGIRCFHLCTLNLELSIRNILDGLNWPQHNDVISMNNVNGGTNSVPINGTSKPLHEDNTTLLSSSVGTVSLMPEGTWSRSDGDQLAKNWDEFPNGRFGDARSPAFGTLDVYGSSLTSSTPLKALSTWGEPTSNEDISHIFSEYLQGRISAIPWNDEAVMSETSSLIPQLLQLNDKTWWTVGSQPAVDGVPSTNPSLGFGPSGGWIYQKPFVEFFASFEDLIMLESKMTRQSAEGRGVFMVRYYAGNHQGELRTNMGPEDSNAVTWGVFHGKEIVTTTKIEKLSFLAWNQEAFNIWREWKDLYPPLSPSRTLIEKIIQERWLISIVHHDYKDQDALWKFLLSN